MYINELYDKLPLLSAETYTYIGRDGDCHTESEPVLTEHILDVYLNDRLTMKLVCIPQYLTELVLGRLLTEGILEDASDVEQIYICEHGRCARVVLSEKEPEKEAPLKPVTPIFWKAEQVFDLADRFHAGMPLHGQTWATHSCFLAKDGQLLFQCEDIGRHNALDKAIGYALRHGIPLSQCMVYSSGRIPTDMAMKTIRAGIPILASKASPTAEAIALAKEYGLTLICAARRDRMKLFAGTMPEG